MVAVGVRQFKANLSRFLKTAQKGTEIEVMSRGKIVARVIGAGPEREQSQEDGLADLAREGLAELPEHRERHATKRRLSPGRGVPASAIVRLQRR